MDCSVAAVFGVGEFGHLDGATMVSVTISERNLADLVKQQGMGRVPVLSRLTEGSYILTLRVEPDDVHYRNRADSDQVEMEFFENRPLGDDNPFPPQERNEP